MNVYTLNEKETYLKTNKYVFYIFSMKSLVSTGVHSIILTSGTLTPFSAVINELGIPLDVQLQNPHVIDKEQVRR
jgi:hypothetical protein